MSTKIRHGIVKVSSLLAFCNHAEKAQNVSCICSGSFEFLITYLAKVNHEIASSPEKMKKHGQNKSKSVQPTVYWSWRDLLKPHYSYTIIPVKIRRRKNPPQAFVWYHSESNLASVYATIVHNVVLI